MVVHRQKFRTFTILNLFKRCFQSVHYRIWDLAFPDLNPFTACRNYLCRVLVAGSRPHSVLSSIFHQFSDGTIGDRRRLMSKAQVMAYDMGAQTFWRFLALRELPTSIAQLVNPGLSAATKQRLCCVVDYGVLF